MNLRMAAVISAVACISVAMAGCGSTKVVSHKGHKNPKKVTTSVTPPPTTSVTPPPAPVNPTVPQPGGLAAATKWLKGYGSIQTIAVRGGYVLLPVDRPALAYLYVNSANNTWVMLPLNLTVSTFERQTTDGGLMFLVQGPEGDGSYSPFPVQELCTLQPDGTFKSQPGPAYFPVSGQSVHFGSKPDQSLANVAITPQGIKFVFGHLQYADYLSVPPTTINYDNAHSALVIDFANTTLGNVAGLAAMHSQFVESVSAERQAQDVVVTLHLAPVARYYTGRINTSAGPGVFLEMDFASSLPAPPWGT